MLRQRNKRSALRHIQTESLERRELLAATALQITVENPSPEGGLAATPFWVGFHNGSFQLGRQNQSADRFGGLELLAEEGDTSELAARFDATSRGIDATITATAGFSGAPVFEPGETVSQIITVNNTVRDRYFSFASMIIPSNDSSPILIRAKCNCSMLGGNSEDVKQSISSVAMFGTQERNSIA